MAMYGQGITRGRVAILGIDAAINQACAALAEMDDDYVLFNYYFLEKNYEKIRSFGHGANQKNLNAALVKAIAIPFPTKKEAKSIGEVLRRQDDIINALRKEITFLDELFYAMLNQLMAATLTVQPLLERGNATKKNEAA